MLWVKSKAEVTASAEGRQYRSREGKKTRDAEAMWTINRVAESEVRKMGMG